MIWTALGVAAAATLAILLFTWAVDAILDGFDVEIDE